tara:strand:- start:33556 stop:34599 length:1044 start_codon:yes stop_codon:yes gene_type:complete
MTQQMTGAALLVALLYTGAAMAEPVYRDGRTWLQPAIPPTSWNALQSLCPPPAARCQGSIGDINLTGYTWATALEVQALFAGYGGPGFVAPGASFSATEQDGSTWAPRIISDFAPQGGDFETQITSGMVSAGAFPGPQAVSVTDRDPPDLPDRVAVTELPSGDLEGSTLGGWFWRDDLPDPRPLILKLEEPVDGEAISGVGNLRGYALGLDGVTKVEIFIDGEYAFDAPYGGSRTDVQDAFPDIPGAESSGFSLAYGYANLSPGEHSITARATSPQGEFAESTAHFTVLAFQDEFIFANQPVEIPTGGVSVSGDELYIDNLSVDGQLFDVTLRWRTATQGFEIIEVR